MVGIYYGDSKQARTRGFSFFSFTAISPVNALVEFINGKPKQARTRGFSFFSFTAIFPVNAVVGIYYGDSKQARTRGFSSKEKATFRPRWCNSTKEAVEIASYCLGRLWQRWVNVHRIIIALPKIRLIAVHGDQHVAIFSFWAFIK